MPGQVRRKITDGVRLAVARRPVEQNALLGRLPERPQLLALSGERQHVAIDQRASMRGQDQMLRPHRLETMNSN